MSVSIVNQKSFANAGAYPLNASTTFDATGATALAVVLITAGAYTFTPAATFAGQSMTSLGQATGTSNTTMWLYGINAPGIGTFNIQSSNYVDIAVAYLVSFSGTNSTTPFGGVNAIDTAVSSVLSVTTTIANSLLVAVGGAYFVTGPTLTASNGFTTVYSDILSQPNVALFVFSDLAATVGTYTTTLTAPYNTVPAGLLTIQPSGGSGGSTINPVAMARAAVKTTSGLSAQTFMTGVSRIGTRGAAAPSGNIHIAAASAIQSHSKSTLLAINMVTATAISRAAVRTTSGLSAQTFMTGVSRIGARGAAAPSGSIHIAAASAIQSRTVSTLQSGSSILCSMLGRSNIAGRGRSSLAAGTNLAGKSSSAVHSAASLWIGGIPCHVTASSNIATHSHASSAQTTNIIGSSNVSVDSHTSSALLATSMTGSSHGAVHSRTSPALVTDITGNSHIAVHGHAFNLPVITMTASPHIAVHGHASNVLATQLSATSHVSTNAISSASSDTVLPPSSPAASLMW